MRVLNPIDAIKVADYMISIGQLKRWTCAKLTGLIWKICDIIDGIEGEKHKFSLSEVF